MQQTINPTPQSSVAAHIRGNSDLPANIFEPREGSQNEVKIEEYDSDQMSGRASRSNSIKFVKLKDDVMFENPHTPELKKVLKNRVNYFHSRKRPSNLTWLRTFKKLDLMVMESKMKKILTAVIVTLA